MTETEIQNQIRTECADLAVLFRINVGAGWTKSGSYLKTGVPKGFPDLCGFRISDGKAVFLEVKRPGKTRSKEQIKMGNALAKYPVIYGVATGAAEAKKMIMEG